MRETPCFLVVGRWSCTTSLLFGKEIVSITQTHDLIVTKEQSYHYYKFSLPKRKLILDDDLDINKIIIYNYY